MDDRLIVDMLQRNIGERIELAAKVNELRARCNQLEFVNNSQALAEAEREPAEAALDEWERYLTDRARLERDACSEPGLWARTPMGNYIALTLYSDMLTQLTRIRTSYGL